MQLDSVGRHLAHERLVDGLAAGGDAADLDVWMVSVGAHVAGILAERPVLLAAAGRDVAVVQPLLPPPPHKR